MDKQKKMDGRKDRWDIPQKHILKQQPTWHNIIPVVVNLCKLFDFVKLRRVRAKSNRIIGKTIPAAINYTRNSFPFDSTLCQNLCPHYCCLSSPMQCAYCDSHTLRLIYSRINHLKVVACMWL